MTREDGKEKKSDRFKAERSQVEALGQSEAFLEFQERLSRVAKVDRPVLILGERGSGKELAARRLHNLSPRWEGPLVALNCAALSPTLIEAELFGHEEGAFTGASRKRLGRFEQADGGTLFLDEIGNIPIETQEKILRTVEYGTFERVGASQPIEVNVRIVGATNSDLLVLSERGRFKRELLDRLSFEALYLPPLRRRQEDIPILANHFAHHMAYELGRDAVPEFSEAAMLRLLHYDWPGNIRELKNVVERAVYQTEGDLIDGIVFDPFESPYRTDLLAAETHPDSPTPPPPQLEGSILDKPLTEAVKELEVLLLNRALSKSRHNQKRAANLLGMTYHQFRWLYQKHKGALGDVED